MIFPFFIFTPTRWPHFQILGKKTFLFFLRVKFKQQIKGNLLKVIFNVLCQWWANFFPVKTNLGGQVALCFLAESCAALNMRAHPEKTLSGWRATRLHPCFFFFPFSFFFSPRARKIQQQFEINHNVLYQSLGDSARKRAVITRGLVGWKNGSRCHKANSL